MPVKTGEININLLPGDDLEKAPFGKFLKWATTYGRYIVVLTELIVLIAFLSRFKLDRDLSDLSDNINRKKVIVESSSQFEQEIRNLQNRLQVVAALADKTQRPSQYLDFLSLQLPQGVTLSTLENTDNKIQLTGVSPSEAGIATLVSSLSQNSQVQSVALESLAKDAKNNSLNFSLSLILWP